MKLDKVYSVLQDRYKYAQDFETANEEDYILEAIEEVKAMEDKLKRRNTQISDLKHKIGEMKKVLVIARDRITELHGNRDRDYSYETLNKIEKYIK